ncbi:hypothetical protein Tco_0045161 [Tanacetum coccineum]
MTKRNTRTTYLDGPMDDQEGPWPSCGGAYDRVMQRLAGVLSSKSRDTWISQETLKDMDVYLPFLKEVLFYTTDRPLLPLHSVYTEVHQALLYIICAKF